MNEIEKTKVVNVKHSEYDVFIGRPSLLGNPFIIGRDGTREEVVSKHYWWMIDWIEHKKEIRVGKYTNREVVCGLWELVGKRIGCFCAPLLCHGDNYVNILNEYPEYAKRQITN